MKKDLLIQKHQARFSRKPETIVFAPGRVNVIGEHTDYNGGYVLPMALSLGVYAAASRNDSGLLRLHSLDFNRYAEFPLDSLKPDPVETWANCPKGIVEMIRREGHSLPGLDITMTGDLPMGAGLSSSAAAEVAVGFAAKTLFALPVEGMALALLAQKAEHAFTGTKCGIMDQAVSVLAQKACVLKLACDTLAFEHIPFRLNGLMLLITNSGVKHNLADGEYNKRRAECQAAFEKAKRIKPGMKSLSDFSADLLEKNRSVFTDIEFRRTRHVLTENERLFSLCALMEKGDFPAAGRLLSASHASLRTDYEVSCSELDWLVENALALPGVLGARMTGGGFGGSMIALMRKEAETPYRNSLAAYRERFKTEAGVIEAVPSQGAREL